MVLFTKRQHVFLHGWVIIIFLIGLTVASFGIVQAASTDATSIIENSSFEELDDRGHPAGFSLVVHEGDVQVSMDNDVARSGERSVRISGASSGRGALQKWKLPIDGGDTYKLTVWYRLESGLVWDRPDASYFVRLIAWEGTDAQADKIPWHMDFTTTPADTLPQIVADGNLYLVPNRTGPQDVWQKLEATFTLPDKVMALDIELFNAFGADTIWWDDLSLERVESMPVSQNTTDTTASGDAALAEDDETVVMAIQQNAAYLRHETLALLRASRLRDKETFERLVPYLDFAAETIMRQQVMSGHEVGKIGNSENEWKYRQTGEGAFVLAIAHALPQSRYYDSPVVRHRVHLAFDYLTEHLSSHGRWHTDDTNVDRFTLAPFLDAYVLTAHHADFDQIFSWTDAILKALQYQYDHFYFRPLPWGGGYPNMDAYYVLIAGLASRLTDDEKWTNSAHVRALQIGERLRATGAYEYVLGWNPSATYQDIVVRTLARYYQVTRDIEIRRQFEVVKAYLPTYMDLNGVIDHGTAPHIKHYWDHHIVNGLSTAPAIASITGDAHNQWYAMEKLSATNLARVIPNNAFDLAHVFLWLGDVEPVAPPADQFVFDAGINGFAQRQNGKFSAFITGNDESRDTFVSAMVSRDGQMTGVLQGAVFEVSDGDYTYYFSDQKPRIRRAMHDDLAVQQVETKLHALGRGVVYPTPITDAIEWSVWDGGSPHVAPWDVNQVWVMFPGWLIGMHTLMPTEDAQAWQTDASFARMHLPMNAPGVSVEVVDDQYVQVGDMGVAVLDVDGDWQLEAKGQRALGPVLSDENVSSKWRQDAPYGVTMVIGEASSESDFYQRLAHDGIYFFVDDHVRAVARVQPDVGIYLVVYNAGVKTAHIALPGEWLMDWQRVDQLHGTRYALTDGETRKVTTALQVDFEQGGDLGALDPGEVNVWEITPAL